MLRRDALGALSAETLHAARLPSAEVSVAESLVPDLLCASPACRIQAEQTKLAIALAFASGVAGGLFADALGAARPIASSWDAAGFANDVFLHQFVALCFKVPTTGGEGAVSTKHLVSVLARPPVDSASVHHRRAILAELTEHAELLSALQRLYRKTLGLRGLLEGGAGLGSWDANRRRLDILRAVKGIVDCMAEEFRGARSGLSRLTAFGSRVQSGEPYTSMAQLLSYDERLATLKLDVCVGADGRIRGFQILAVEEDQQNPFASSPLRRWLAKLELFVRGFKLGDGEVMARLIDAVFEGLEDELVPIIQLLGDLEFYLGALGFREMSAAAGLPVCLPELTEADEPRVLLGLFNPLLAAQGSLTVPCDLTLDRNDVTVLVTGPNSGGKTRLLQSIALTQLLAQAGAFVPARSACCALAPALVVSLLQETRADQPEGRLGMELLRIRTLFERLPPGAMVLLDELCSGTNPSEGEEIFELVVRMLGELGPQGFITTHFLTFAARLERERSIAGLRFLQVELGRDEQPTYQFMAGVARTSLASHAAARLGVTAEQLMTLIERNRALASRTPHSP